MRPIDPQNPQNWNLAKRVSLDDVRASLIAKGWIPEDDKKGAVYNRADADVAGFHLPSTLDDAGVLQIFNSAYWLGVYEKRTADDVLTEWATPPFDRVKFRLISDHTDDGSIPLVYSRELLNGVFASLVCAVKDVETPTRFHKRVYSSLTEELASRAVFEQTQKGSYVVVVRTPLNSNAEEGVVDETKTHVFRRAAEHLMKALRRVATNNETNDDVERAFQETTASSNLFDAFFNASCEGQADLDVSIEWATLLKPDEKAPSHVFFKRENARRSHAWAKALRPKPREITQEFCGVVVAMNATSNRNEPLEGKVVLRIDEEEPFDAETLLPPDYFKIAYDAFYPGDELLFNARAVRQDGKTILYDVVKLRRA